MRRPSGFLLYLFSCPDTSCLASPGLRSGADCVLGADLPRSGGGGAAAGGLALRPDAQPQPAADHTGQAVPSGVTDSESLEGM